MTNEVEGLERSPLQWLEWLAENSDDMTISSMALGAEVVVSQVAEMGAAALRAQAERVRVLEGERDEARNAVVKCKDVALAIADRIEDEGDRAYFGSTNDPDTLKALARELDALHWHYVRPAPHPTLLPATPPKT